MGRPAHLPLGLRSCPSAGGGAGGGAPGCPGSPWMGLVLQARDMRLLLSFIEQMFTERLLCAE